VDWDLERQDNFERDHEVECELLEPMLEPGQALELPGQALELPY
jgi:hypothetical protein